MCNKEMNGWILGILFALLFGFVFGLLIGKVLVINKDRLIMLKELDGI